MKKVKNSIGVIKGNNNTQIITINSGRNNKVSSNKVDVKVAPLILFAKNNFAYPKWGKAFSVYDRNGQPENADAVIRKVFETTPEKDYPVIFKTIKKMYSELSGEPLKELKEIFKLFRIDYDMS
jgi:hypothetical protein